MTPSHIDLTAPAAVTVSDNPSRKHNYNVSTVLHAYAECMITGALGSTKVMDVITSGNPSF